MNNKQYDIIVAKYEEYGNYNSFLERKKLELKDKRKALLEEIMNHNLTRDEIEIKEEQKTNLFDLQTEEKIYHQDAQILFYNLYLLVENYLQLEDTIVLPKDITELCTELTYTIPKTVFIVNNKGYAEEREKGKLKEIQNPWYKDEQVKSFSASIENQIKQALKSQEITPE